MVPRADIEAVDMNMTIGELMIHFEETGRSRMPVYRETLDDPAAWSTSAISSPIWPSRRATSAAVGTKASGADLRDAVNGTEKAAPPRQPKAGCLRSRPRRPRTDCCRSRPYPQNAVRTALHAGVRPVAIDAGWPAHRWLLSSTNTGAPTASSVIEDIVEMVIGDVEDEHDNQEAMLSHGSGTMSSSPMPVSSLKRFLRPSVRDFDVREPHRGRRYAWRPDLLGARPYSGCAAKSSRPLPASNSRSSMPIRVASSASRSCASALLPVADR